MSAMGLRCRFGRDRSSTNVRFASIPTVNSGLWDLSRCAISGSEQSQRGSRYSITSVRASSDGGTSRPSAFAVSHVTNLGTEGSPTRPMTYCEGTADE